MRYVIIIFSFLIFCSGQKLILKIGGHVPQELLIEPSPYVVMTSSASFENAIKITILNIKYVIAVNEDNKISFISTIDTNFTSPEGIKIGTQLANLKNIFDSDFIEVRGWLSYVTLPSGWNAASFTKQSAADSLRADDIKVDLFFKK